MSIAQAMPAMSRASGSRWLLLGSLALNLFFVGVALAMAIRAPAPPRWDPDVFVRVDRLSAALPADDAARLRAAMAARHDAIASAQTEYHDARDQIRAIVAANRSMPRPCAPPWRRPAPPGRISIKWSRAYLPTSSRNCRPPPAIRLPTGRQAADRRRGARERRR